MYHTWLKLFLKKCNSLFSLWILRYHKLMLLLPVSRVLECGYIPSHLVVSCIFKKLIHLILCIYVCCLSAHMCRSLQSRPCIIKKHARSPRGAALRISSWEMLHTHRSCCSVFPVLGFGKLSRERALGQKACLESKHVCLFEVSRSPWGRLGELKNSACQTAITRDFGQFRF